jgi:outer membrane biosynthesis protein TonB
MTLRFPIRAGIAASVLAHLGLVGAVLLFAEVRPFAEVPEQRIEVDVVTADEAPPVPEPKPEAKPALDLPEFKPTAESEPAAQQPPAKPEPAQKQEPAKPEPAKPEPVQKQADAPKPEPEPPKAEPPQPAPQAQQQAQQPAPAPFPPAIAQEPDLTVKYSVALGLPTDPAFDGPAEIAADISADAVAALRQRIKSCAALPASVGPSDNVRIVLRVALRPDGRLAQEPILIEASASAKGPALMQGAIDALSKCQPYGMLPADKYKEWKVLDIGFTPQDFRGG